MYLRFLKSATYGKDVEKSEPTSTVGRNAKWCSRREKQSGSSSKLKHRVTSNSTPRYVINRNGNTHPHKNLYTHVHSSIIHKSQKVETTQMATNG